MTPEGRDLRIVQWVARFGQLGSGHIQTLDGGFELKSSTPYSRALRRLTANGYLIRIERRMVGGTKGGSGQYVYALGRKGYYLFHEGRYNPARNIRYHSIAIADAFLEFRRLEYRGLLKINGFSSEPDCHVSIGGVVVRPDMTLDINLPDATRLQLFIEVDQGTETQAQIRSKLDMYWRAYNNADIDEWPIFPKVLFIGIDEARAKELKWIIGRMPDDAQALFDVTTRERLASTFQA